MSGARMRNFCFAMIATALINPVQAVEIKYNEDNRPVEFIDLDINGESWYVSVNWDGRMVDTYGINGQFVEPTFYGEDTADDAAAAMQQALINDTYTGTILTSYLWVPKSYHSTAHFYMGPGVFLHQAGLPIARVDVGFYNIYGTVGYTIIRLFEDGFEDK